MTCRLMCLDGWYLALWIRFLKLPLPLRGVLLGSPVLLGTPDVWARLDHLDEHEEDGTDCCELSSSVPGPLQPVQRADYLVLYKHCNLVWLYTWV